MPVKFHNVWMTLNWYLMASRFHYIWCKISYGSANTWWHLKWKHFLLYWPFVQGIQRSPVNSPRKSQWCRALMYSLICAWIKGWANNHEAGDLRRHHAYYDVIGMRGPEIYTRVSTQYKTNLLLYLQQKRYCEYKEWKFYNIQIFLMYWIMKTRCLWIIDWTSILIF